VINRDILLAAVMDSRDGITISDFSLPDNPLVFINPAFERMTGYLLEDVEGKNCRFLQGNDKEQEDKRNIISDAINQKKPCLVTLKNYRKDGSMFWNELSISPIFNDDGKITHWLGIQKDVTNRVLMEERIKYSYNELKQSNTMLEYLVNIDALTGIYNRRYLKDQLRIQWKIAIRQKQLLSIFMLDIDHFKKYNDTYGHAAGDEALKRIAQELSHSFVKSTDFVARYGGEEFIILTIGGDPSQIAQYAELVVKKVSALSIPQGGSDKNIVTVSLGFSSAWPSRDQVYSDIIKQADEALYQAKNSGRNRAISYTTLVS
jgi:diguanylate cyclase (GGDEF)-like protein/PAS domain S-box-containing protein